MRSARPKGSGEGKQRHGCANKPRPSKEGNGKEPGNANEVWGEKGKIKLKKTHHLGAGEDVCKRVKQK